MYRLFLFLVCILGSGSASAQRQKVHLLAGRLHYALLEFDKASANFQIATTHRKTAGAAHFYLGRMAALGEGQPVNHPKAMQHYRAGLAHKFSLNHLGIALAYKFGDGVRQNTDSAAFHFKQVPFLVAENYDFKEAFEHYYYAMCLYNGHYLKADKPASIVHFKRVWSTQMLHAGHYLASCHFEGCHGVPQPDSAAYYWAEMARRNYKPAMQNMASMYLQGNGVPRDSLKAADMLYKIGVKHVDAMSSLQAAKIYLNIGARKDTALAVIRALAQNGDGVAACELGHIYYQGVFKQRNYAEAIKWYEIAGKAFNHEALFALAGMYEEGRGVPTDFVKALELYKQSALLGNAAAMYQAGYMYEMGKGSMVNYCEAVMWYEKAAKLFHAQAIFRLGLCTFYENRCVSNDVAYAITLFEQAAGLGETSAALNLALIYTNGIKVPKDAFQADFWLRETIRQSPNNPTALFNLGKAGIELKDMKMPVNEAIMYLEKAGDIGNPDAFIYLARMFEKGHYVSLNFAEAIRYLKKLPPTMRTEEQIAALFAKGHKTLPRDSERAFMHLFQAFALAQDAADEQRLKQQMKTLGQQISATKLHHLFELPSEEGGLGLNHKDADELLQLMRKQGLIK